MARSLTGRELALLAGLAVAGVGAFWLFGPDAEGEGRLPDDDKKIEGKALAPAPVVHMELVDRRVDSFEEDGRDLFKYTQRPLSARERARLRAEALAAQREAERLAALEAEEARRRNEMEAARQAELAKLPPPPPPRPEPPPIGFKYIGYLGPKNDRIAVFDDAGETLLAKKGETVREQFRVVEVKYDTVVMGFVRKEFQNDTRELPLTGKK